MRNPDRIDPIVDRLREAWKANPDLRLTQLVWNLASSPGETAPRFYNTEDDDLDWEPYSLAGPDSDVESPT